jgi:SAM-dependent methyltransferase
MAENRNPAGSGGAADDVESVVPAEGAEYYGGVYWNNYHEVISHINRRVSGDGDVDPWTWFHRQTGRKFRRALVVNCGNGWVERELIQRGIIESAVGVDVLPELLEEAQRAAVGLPIRYELGDTNRAEFPGDDVDLVINNAAFHHIAYPDRVLRRCCELLPIDGVLVNNDYVGAHRNQYDYDTWAEVHRVNELLPETLRHELVYPHLPTMLVADATEAVHSELTLEVTRRYFDIAEYRSVGGAIAYPLLTHNTAMWSAEPGERSRWIMRVLDEDERWDGGDLFAFYFGHPRKSVLEDSEALDRWRTQEEERERVAASHGGTYYSLTLLQHLTQRLCDAEIARDHLRLSLDEAFVENERLRSMSATQAASVRSGRWSARVLRIIRSAVRGSRRQPVV